MVKVPTWELFKAGDYGENGKYSESEIDDIIKNTNERKTDIPIIAGHKEVGKEKGALGWIKHNLFSRRGGVLNGEPSVLEELKENVLDRGILKHRSIGIRGDRKTGKKWIDHIALLGSSIPRVKGLKELGLSFSDDDETEIKIINFDEQKKTEVTRKMDKEKEETVVKFSEAQVESLKNDALAKQKAEFTVQFSEMETKLSEKDTKIKELETEVKNFSEKVKVEEIKNMVNGFVKDRKLIPAKVEDTILNFSETYGTKTYDRLKAEIESREPLELGEDKHLENFSEKNKNGLDEVFGTTADEDKKYKDGIVLK